MFCLDNSDVLEAWASVDAKIDCVIDGLVDTVYKNLYTGTLSNGANTHVYVATTDIAVISAKFTNTHSSAVTLSFKIDPTNGGNPKWLVPVDVSLEAGYTLLFDGQRCSITDTSGRVIQSVAVSDAAYGAGWNGITDTAASKNAIYDQMELRATIESPTFTTKITTPIIDLTGGQIAFPAIAVPSGDPNTLDDYEEGTFIPALEFGGGTTGITYTAETRGQYRKIGSIIIFSLAVVLSNKGSSNGLVLITGLPFTSIAVYVSSISISQLFALSFADFPSGFVKLSDTTIPLQQTSNAGVLASITDADFANNSQIYISGSYPTT